ncbi:MAG: SUMF1/EgtB/PvdO family nonheme iron enzyme [Bacteroidota bacterium]
MNTLFTFRHLLCALLVLVVSTLMANNIHVTNVTLANQNTVNGTTQVRFDLSWENSWRISVGPANWDAAWVFVKYRVNGTNWQHATINNAGQVAPSGATVEPQDNLGAMIYRSADGSGNVDYQNIELQWAYDTDGVDVNAVVDVQVFAIEMVYIPQGEFSMGTPGFTAFTTEITNFFYTRPANFPELQIPYRVQSEAAITVGDTPGNLYYAQDNSSGGDLVGPIPAAFPKGFDAFYVMKYETSQDQWIAFFNTLTTDQKAANDITGSQGKNSDGIISRNAVSWPESGNATTSLPNVAVSYISAAQTLAYLDWAGLRPISELEYEKSCRGPLDVVLNEFAWGNANVTSNEYVLQNEGMDNESVVNPGEGIGNGMNLNTNGAISGPFRVGIFAASAVNASREETGGTYYGVMEMSGNLYERCITVGTPRGRSFSGIHGNGEISFNGQADVANWPNNTSGDGFSYRGASWINSLSFQMVSDRFDGASVIASGNNRIGFRGGRSAQ